MSEKHINDNNQDLNDIVNNVTPDIETDSIDVDIFTNVEDDNKRKKQFLRERIRKKLLKNQR